MDTEYKMKWHIRFLFAISITQWTYCLCELSHPSPTNEANFLLASDLIFLYPLLIHSAPFLGVHLICAFLTSKLQETPHPNAVTSWSESNWDI